MKYDLDAMLEEIRLDKTQNEGVEKKVVSQDVIKRMVKARKKAGPSKAKSEGQDKA